MDDNIKRMLDLAGVGKSDEKLNHRTNNLNEHIIGGMREVRHVSESPDHYNMNDDEVVSDTEEDELHDVEMIIDDMDADYDDSEVSDDVSELIAQIIDVQDSGMSALGKTYNIDTLMKLNADSIRRIYSKVIGDEYLWEYDQEGIIGDDFDMDDIIEIPQSSSESDVEYDLGDGTRDAEPDVSELITQIEEIQEMGLSASNRHYDISKLINLPAKIVTKIHSNVIGDKNEVEESAEYIEGYDDEIEVKKIDVDTYFPDGAHGQVTDSTGAAGAHKGDNPLQKTMRVTESSKDIHRKFVNEYRRFLKENKR